MPVWHASVSMRDTVDNVMRSPTQIERHAITACAGVGNDREWWIYNTRRAIGHLRVGVTLEEYGQLGYYVAAADAGPAGPERPRTPYKRKAKT
jgi:hypothetical protein